MRIMPILMYLYDAPVVTITNDGNINANNYDDFVVWHGPGSKPSWDVIVASYDEAVHVEALNALRLERNRLLFESDWTQVADAPVDKGAWADYRQALRDLPENTIDPKNPVWPTPPA